MRMLERWVDEYQPILYRAAVLILRDPQAAEDVAQETFLRAHRAAARLEPNSDIRGWLYRIAVNLSLNRLRSLRREAAALARVDAPVVEDIAELRATRSALAEGLRRLPDRLRV